MWVIESEIQPPRSRRSYRTSRTRIIGILAALIAIIMLAPKFAPYDVTGVQEVADQNYQSPSWSHPMGTDQTDRDLLSMVLRGARTSVTIGAGAVVVALLLGTTYGTVSAMSGGWVDSLMMRMLDVALALPRFLILLAATSISDRPMSVAYLVLLIGVTGWFGTARLIHGEATSLLARDWVLAARSSGVGFVRLAIHQIFPHLVPMLIVLGTISIGHTIVLEAALAFLGAGSSGQSLGTLLHSGSAVFSHWWIPVFPGLTIVLIVFAFNALGEALRDVLSPQPVHSWPTS